jgi:hypothetical protein
MKQNYRYIGLLVAIGHHMYDAEGQRRRRALLVSPRWVGEVDVLLCPSPASAEGSGADMLYCLGASGRLVLLHVFPTASPEVGGANVLTLILQRTENEMRWYV